MAETKLVQVSDLATLASKIDSLFPKKTAVTAEIDEKVGARLASTYKAAGTAADVAGLPELAEANLGKVVNMTAAFETTADFVDGAGTTLPAGTNVAVVEGADAGTYKYDALAGIVDMTAYAKTADVSTELDKKVNAVEGKTLSTNDYTTEEKNKLAGLTIATQADVEAAINTSLGVTTPTEPETGDEG